MNNETVILIPARLESKRLPHKPLVKINGKSLIARVLECAKATKFDNIFVACDSQEVVKEVEAHGGRAILTDADLASGTDRIYSALCKIENNEKFKYIVNVQGDLPNIDPHIITATVELLQNSSYDIGTVAYKILNQSEIDDPNVVKIVTTLDDDGVGKAVYFSRSAVPYGEGDYFGHIGIYGYRRTSIAKFVTLEQGALEQREKLEQLRALENNMTIGVKLVNSRPIAIDTKKDLDRASKVVR